MLEKLVKFVNMYEASYDKFEGVLVFKNQKVYDTDFTSILLYDDTFYFEFNDDRFEDFEIKVDDTQDIEFGNIGDIKGVYLHLNNGDIISVHCM